MTFAIRAKLVLEADDAPDLFVLRVDGAESLGKPYAFTVMVGTKDATTFDVRTLIGEKASLRFVRDEDVIMRSVNGVVTEVVDALGAEGELTAVYTLTIEPPLALLGRIEGQEVYVGKPIPDVIKAKFEQGSLDLPHELRMANANAYVDDSSQPAKWSDSPATSHPTEPRLVTQYKETDLAFVMRLAEHVGLAMFFEADDAGDKTVFADHNDGFSAAFTVSYRGDGQDHGLVELRLRTRWVPTTVMVGDYNYRAPTQKFRDSAGAEVFDVIGARADLPQEWPGMRVEFGPNALSANEAALIATARAGELASASHRYEGHGRVPELRPGLKIKITGNNAVESTQEIVVTDTKHTYTAPAPSAGGTSKAPNYTVEFQGVPTTIAGQAVIVRAQRRTPKPVIAGIVTGVVIGATSEASPQRQHLDTVGRYLIKPHFVQGDMPTLPRIRLAQAHAGPNYGIHFPLRPGTEVVIAYRDGDPDRPVILAAIPNAITQSPVVATSQEGAVVEPNRILTRSGILIELSDGDPT